MNPWLLFGNTQFQSCPKCIEIFAEFLVWYLPIQIPQRNWNNARGGFGSFADWSRWMKFNIHFFIAAQKFMTLPLNFTDFNWKQPRGLGISSSAFFLLPSTQDQKNISTKEIWLCLIYFLLCDVTSLALQYLLKLFICITMMQLNTLLCGRRVHV